jgi:excisionase family DNA binding protein
MTENWLTLKEIEQQYNIKERVLRAGINKGYLPARKVGNAYLILKTDLDTFIKDHLDVRYSLKEGGENE